MSPLNFAFSSRSKAAPLIAFALALVFMACLPSGNAAAKSNQDYFLGSFTYANGATLNASSDLTSATVTLSNLNVTYDDKSQAAIATTNPPGLKVSITYNGKSSKPVNAGSYSVIANVTSSGYTGSASGTLVIAQEPCTITFTKLAFTYNGSEQKAQAKTSPSAAGATFTYNGSATAPTLVGSYTVVATAKSPNYTGTATGTETIAPVAPSVSNEGTTTIGAFSATLKAQVNPKGSSTTVTFEYGPTSSYGSTTSSQVIPAGNNGVEVTANISGLQTTTKYHFRAVATNGSTKDGSDATFTTAEAPILSGTTSASVGASGGEVLGTVTPNGVETTAYFQYGTSMSYGLTTTMQNLGKGKTAVAVDGIFPNLQPNTTYYYQLVTVSSAGTFYGATGSFTTLSFDTVLVQASGDTAPVPNVSGATYEAFGIPIVNNNGHYAFFGELNVVDPITSTTNLALFKDNINGDLQYLTRTGDVAPGTASAVYSSVSDPVYNDSNQNAYEGLLKVVSGQATTSTDQGIWSGASGSLQLVAREGDQAPGCPTGATFLSFYSVSLPNSGGCLISATLTSGSGGVNSTNNSGIWQGTTTSDLHLVQRLGDVVDGKTLTLLSFAQNLQYVGGQTRNFLETGDIAFGANFSDGTNGVIKRIGGVSTLAYSTGSSAPGTLTPGATFSGFDNPAINANDHLAFAAALKTGSNGVSNSNSFGIWAEDGTGTLQAIAQEGGNAPGTPATYFVISDPVYNIHDAVAFRAQLNDVSGSINYSNNIGIWSNVSGSLQLVVQTNEQAPGCPPGANFNDFQDFALPDVNGPNDDGGLMFLGTLTANTSAGVNSSNELGIWAFDPSGNLQLIIRTGNILNINGTNKVVTNLSFLDSGAYVTGQTRNFSQTNGDLVYIAGFADGSSAICSVTFP